jgi:hypothetical protein
MNYTQKLLPERLINKVLMNGYSVNCPELLILQKISNKSYINIASVLENELYSSCVTNPVTSHSQAWPPVLLSILLYQKTIPWKSRHTVCTVRMRNFLFYVRILFW